MKNIFLIIIACLILIGCDSLNSNSSQHQSQIQGCGECTKSDLDNVDQCLCSDNVVDVGDDLGFRSQDCRDQGGQLVKFPTISLKSSCDNCNESRSLLGCEFDICGGCEGV